VELFDKRGVLLSWLAQGNWVGDQATARSKSSTNCGPCGGVTWTSSFSAALEQGDAAVYVFLLWSAAVDCIAFTSSPLLHPVAEDPLRRCLWTVAQ